MQENSSQLSVQEVDLVDRSKKKVKEKGEGFSGTSSIPVCYAAIYEGRDEVGLQGPRKTYADSLRGQNPDQPTVQVRLEDTGMSSEASEDSEAEEEESDTEEGLLVVEKMVGEYDCPEFVLAEKEQRRIQKPWKKGIIVKLLGRKIGFRALETSCGKFGHATEGCPSKPVAVGNPNVPPGNDKGVEEQAHANQVVPEAVKGPWVVVHKGRARVSKAQERVARAKNDSKVKRGVNGARKGGVAGGSRFGALQENDGDNSSDNPVVEQVPIVVPEGQGRRRKVGEKENYGKAKSDHFGANKVGSEGTTGVSAKDKQVVTNNDAASAEKQLVQMVEVTGGQVLEVGVSGRWDQSNINQSQGRGNGRNNNREENMINGLKVQGSHGMAQLPHPGLHPMNETRGLANHITRPPEKPSEVSSPSSQSLEACIEAEEAYQWRLRDEKRPMVEDDYETFQDMELEFVPETQENGLENARDTFDQ
ncbi:hypothetical protein RIF29_00769 [Crotalaria pallida]|uniref:Uncharacterized protein n=1 Tax=Crotalaria pallida TaxID=3830 RepID=A0AAN9IWK4_CROPI